MTKTIQQRLVEAGLPPLPRSVWLEIDEAVLAHNVDVFKPHLGRGVGLNAVAKADAYGHGLVPVARVFERAGAVGYASPRFDEAVALRDGGRDRRLSWSCSAMPLVEDRPSGGRIGVSAVARTTRAVTLDGLVRCALDRDGPDLNIHVEVETGLTRGGLQARRTAGRVAQDGRAAARPRRRPVDAHRVAR